MAWWGGGGYWPEYVPVAKRIARAKKAAEKLRKKGVEVQPVELSGRKIAASFWGKGWCDHMDSFHDYENRLPRGRSYVRNGSVVHLDVSKGKVTALVAGSEVYTVEVRIDLLSETRWQWIKKQCSGQISSLMDLLKGKLSDGVMRVVADRDNGLFPGPKEIEMRCSCPDIAGMCKHIAAVFYGVGARLDSRPELLFLLRGVDHAELAAQGGVDAVIDKGRGAEGELAGADLAEMFGIELVDGETVTPTANDVAPPSRIPRAPAANSRRTGRENARGKKSAAMMDSEKSDSPGVAVKVETPRKTKLKPQKKKTGTRDKAAVILQSPQPASKKPKTALKPATKSDAKRLAAVERLSAAYAAGKKETKAKKTSGKKGGK